MACVAVLVVSAGFYMTVSGRLNAAYRDAPPAQTEQTAHLAPRVFEEKDAPIIGDRFFSLFSTELSSFYHPLLLLSVFYIPTVILLMSLFAGIGSFGLAVRRDYGTLAVCTLSSWAAANLPFALAGLFLYGQSVDPLIYWAMWVASALLFGVFMIFALRTVFGANYGVAAVVVSVAWLSMSLGIYVLEYVSPWLFSPFLLFFLVLHFGGFLGGEMRGFGNAFRQKQNLKRFLHNATVNPKDADAHVQLGLIYRQRRQEAKALEHLEKALAIDENEIDANYEMGKIARVRGELQKALDHFAVVAGQNDKHALSEIWREIGATYLAANMLSDARDALEKFVDRRATDVEGLYLLGKVLKTQGETERAAEIFREAVECAQLSPDFRRGSTNQWRRLAQKEL